MEKRLTPTLLQELRNLYDTRKAAEEFYLYDPWETNPKFSHDPTGT